MRRFWRWLGLAAVAFAVVVVIVLRFFVDEPLRRHMEASLNQAVEGYSFGIGRLHFHPLGFGIDLYDVTIRQDANPEPPTLHVDRLGASVHWAALVHARVVADFVVEHPVAHLDLRKVRDEAARPTPVQERKTQWQDAVERIYPLKINLLRISDGDFTYVDERPFEPLHLSQLNVIATNIRNVRSRDRTYPSELHLDTMVFDRASLRIDGFADFLAVPHAGIAAGFAAEGVPLGYMRPVARHYNLDIRRGTLNAVGQLEYSPTWKSAQLHEMTLFVDVKVYDPDQDADKSVGQKVYEGLVGGVATVLRNQPRDQVATKVDLSGRLDNPQTSTLQAVLNVVRNGFFKAFLPGLERERRS